MHVALYQLWTMANDIFCSFLKIVQPANSERPFPNSYLMSKKNRWFFSGLPSMNRGWEEFPFIIGGNWYTPYVPSELFPLPRVFTQETTWPSSCSWDSKCKESFLSCGVIHRSQNDAINIYKNYNNHMLLYMSRLCFPQFVHRWATNYLALQEADKEHEYFKIYKKCIKEYRKNPSSIHHVPLTPNILKMLMDSLKSVSIAKEKKTLPYSSSSLRVLRIRVKLKKILPL
ncbi:uncharacterized protein LOC133798089 [Humulus lupulus]|uniref:uncharacterized protein LOC133798089 n=1 Tax=Humulus lupulus TaxID=3486 RepID=UPI002B407E7B|nr:uncharacterized protein LOC133798089 [Humulus lupulus]